MTDKDKKEWWEDTDSSASSDSDSSYDDEPEQQQPERKKPVATPKAAQKPPQSKLNALVTLPNNNITVSNIPKNIKKALMKQVLDNKIHLKKMGTIIEKQQAILPDTIKQKKMTDDKIQAIQQNIKKVIQSKSNDLIQSLDDNNINDDDKKTLADFTKQAVVAKKQAVANNIADSTTEKEKVASAKKMLNAMA